MMRMQKNRKWGETVVVAVCNLVCVCGVFCCLLIIYFPKPETINLHGENTITVVRQFINILLSRLPLWNRYALHTSPFNNLLCRKLCFCTKFLKKQEGSWASGVNWKCNARKPTCPFARGLSAVIFGYAKRPLSVALVFLSGKQKPIVFLSANLSSTINQFGNHPH